MLTKFVGFLLQVYLVRRFRVEKRSQRDLDDQVENFSHRLRNIGILQEGEEEHDYPQTQRGFSPVLQEQGQQHFAQDPFDQNHSGSNTTDTRTQEDMSDVQGGSVSEEDRDSAESSLLVVNK